MILLFNISLSFYPITSQHDLSNSKTQLCQVRTQWCCVFLQTQLQHFTVKEHIFGKFTLANLTFGLCTSPTEYFPFTYHPLNVHTMCVVDGLQRLRFVNSQSPDKFTVNTKIVSHLTSLQEIPKHQINVNIYIVHHLLGKWHSPISPQTGKISFFDSYSFHVTSPTHIRPSFLTTNHPPNTLQGHLSPFHSIICPLTNLSNILWPTHLSCASLT